MKRRNSYAYVVLIGVLFLTGCAGRTVEQSIHEEYRDKLEVEAARSNEPPNIVVGRIRAVRAWYVQQMEALR